MKKVLIALVIGFLFNGTSYAFNDVNESETEVYFLKDSNVVQGRSLGFFNPNANVNRAEMLKILLESIDISPNGDIYNSCFPDVNNEWFARYVCYAKENNIISGYPDGFFRPGNTVNLAEALKMSFNSFGQELEESDGDWFVSFLDTAKYYNIADINVSASQLVSRKLMSQLATRVGVVSVTQNKYVDSDLVNIRRWGKHIQDFSDPVESETILSSLKYSGGNSVLTITATSPQTFKFEYAHDTIIAGKGSSDLDQDPTIEVRSNGIKFGLNADRRWDGFVKYKNNESILEADVDLTGFHSDSVNLRWIPDRSMVIYDKMGENIINIGDTTELPFEICVSDAEGYYGSIRVISMSTVILGSCVNKSKILKPTIEELVKKLRTPGVFKPILPIKPKNPPLINKPGGFIDDDGSVELPEEAFEDEDLAPTTDVGNGVMIGAGNPPFPAPNNHPGKHNSPDNGYVRLELAIQNLEDRNAVASETAEDNDQILQAIITETEEAFEQYGISTMAVPKYDPSKCCPSYKKEGKCCTDLDLSTSKGRAEYQKRINCLLSDYNENVEKLNEYIENARQFAQDVKDMALMEANFAQLAAALKLNKVMAHIVIDVATGATSSMKGVISDAIGNVFGSLESGVFDGISNPSSLPNNYGSLVAGSMASEVLDFQNNVGRVAGEVADSMGLTGSRRDAFIQNAKDKFGDNPMDLFDPSVWSKFIYDAVVNEAGSAAESIVKAVERLRSQRDMNYKAAWETAHLLKQINEVIEKVRTEDCSKKLVEELKKEVKRRKEAEKKYRNRKIEDAKAVLESIKWILNYKLESMVGDNPSPEEVKEKLMNELEKKLCLLGYDLCWVDIKMELTFKKTEDGIEWTIKNYKLIKRKTRREPCDCPFAKNLLNTDSVDAQDQESIDENLNNNETTPETEVCCECTLFIPEEYNGRVKFDVSIGRFVASDECNHDIPEHIINDWLEALHPGEAPIYFDKLRMPENEDVEFDFSTGLFYRSGVEIDIL